MENVEIKVVGDVMTITLKLSHPTRPSGSGKTQVIATTSGNVKVATPKGDVFVGLNVYRK